MICTATVTHDYHHYHPQGHAHQLISGMVVTYPLQYLHREVKGRAFLKKPLAPLQSHLYQHLVSSITALGAGELRRNKKGEICILLKMLLCC